MLGTVGFESTSYSKSGRKPNSPSKAMALFAAQSFLNIAMSIGLAPVTGITLPLMSYGGSSLLSSFLALGLLSNVALRRLYLIAPRPFEWRE